MKAKNFGLAVVITAAFETFGYDLNHWGIFASFGAGTEFFFCFVLLPLGAFIISYVAISQRKEENKIERDSVEISNLTKKVERMEAELASVKSVLMNQGLIVENPETESGFKVVHPYFLGPKQAPKKLESVTQ